ncbi:ABC transporter permease [Rhodococcus sp. IEGM 1366]|uniref:ABC transporter permease n=1 Tax=Rhodococcus sp. IEGM 1366 TaxID=3082223 RepID=UPI002953A08F|nr:ABC transporter permease [Rhodococcus sp. IEGM 1366]MDV8070703.1 ABC transporter permease [Rhodococcus sp. IEGM 1366]
MTQLIDTAAELSSPKPETLPGGRRKWRPRFEFNSWALLLLPVVIFLLVVFVLPLVMMFSKSFTDPTVGLGNYRAIWENSLYLKVLKNTFVVAISTTVLTVLIAFPYAYLMTLATPFWRAVMLIAVLVPFWTSLLVRSFALVLVLRDTGVLNVGLQSIGLIDEPLPLLRNMSGVLFGMVQITLPFAVLPLYATMRGIDRRLLQAAESLGARPSLAFFRVFVPLTLPGLFAGVILVFIQALGYYITPALLGGPQNTMIGELIVQQVSTVLRFGFAAALGAVLLVSTLVLLGIASRFVDMKKYLMGQP